MLYKINFYLKFKLTKGVLFTFCSLVIFIQLTKLSKHQFCNTFSATSAFWSWSLITSKGFTTCAWCTWRGVTCCELRHASSKLTD